MAGTFVRDLRVHGAGSGHVPKSGGRRTAMALSAGVVLTSMSHAGAATTLTVDLATTIRPVPHVANGSLCGVTETIPADDRGQRPRRRGSSDDGGCSCGLVGTGSGRSPVAPLGVLGLVAHLLLRRRRK